jgi:hypothetical protein
VQGGRRLHLYPPPATGLLCGVVGEGVCGGRPREVALQVTGVVPRHINAGEPRALDYNDYNQPSLYNPDAYRSSDHDPVIVGLRLGKWRKVWLPVVVSE